MSAQAFSHPTFGKEVRIEQFGREVHLIFVAGSRAQSDSMCEELLRQLKGGAIEAGVCPVCGGDCAGANPPVTDCPMIAAAKDITFGDAMDATSWRADEIERLSTVIREAFDSLPDDPDDAYRALKHSGVINNAR